MSWCFFFVVFISAWNNFLLTFSTPTNRKTAWEVQDWVSFKANLKDIEKFLDVEKKYFYMIVLTDFPPTHNTGRPVQDSLLNTSRSERGSAEDDMTPNGTNSSFSQSKLGKNV